MVRTPALLLFCLLLVLSLAGTAAADAAAPGESPAPSSSDWSIRIGALGMVVPEYEGSDDYEVRGFPLVDITWRNTIFLHSRDGLGAYVLNRPELKLGFALGYTFGRDEDDSDDLDGLGDVDPGLTANALLKWQWNLVEFDARYEHQVSGENTGFQVHLGLGYDLKPTSSLILKPSLRTSFASSDYMEAYFGVSASQSARSGLRVYDADAGFKSVGAQILAIYRLSPHWGLQALTGYDRLVGDAADSPIVQAKDQYRAGLGLSYTF